jgi:3-dehydroquinate dehydratase-2
MPRHDAPEKILILHGPNLNLFGRREPHIYGSMTLDQIHERLRTWAAKIQVQLTIVQSNHEAC